MQKRKGRQKKTDLLRAIPIFFIQKRSTSNSSVVLNGDMTPKINENYNLVIYLDVRTKRIKLRAIDKFGDRVITGGDVHDQKKVFCIGIKTPNKIENWLNTLSCKSMRLDETKPIQ